MVPAAGGPGLKGAPATVRMHGSTVAGSLDGPDWEACQYVLRTPLQKWGQLVVWLGQWSAQTFSQTCTRHRSPPITGAKTRSGANERFQ
eukprot:861121-Pelagomonas_calceolata.AAC.5